MIRRRCKSHWLHSREDYTVIVLCITGYWQIIRREELTIEDKKIEL